MKLYKNVIMMLVILMLAQTISVFADDSDSVEWITYTYTEKDMKQVAMVIGQEIGITDDSVAYKKIQKMLLDTIDSDKRSEYVTDVINTNDCVSAEPGINVMRIHVDIGKQYFFMFFYQDKKMTLYEEGLYTKTYDVYDSIFSIDEAINIRDITEEDIYNQAMNRYPQLKEINKSTAYDIIQCSLIHTEYDIEREIYKNLLDKLKETTEKKVVIRIERKQFKLSRRYY